MIGQPRLPGGILVLVSLAPSTIPAAAAAAPPPAAPARACCHFINRTQSARNPANAANKVIATSFSAKPITCISFNNLPASPALYLFCFVSKTLKLPKHHEPGNLIISTQVPRICRQPIVVSSQNPCTNRGTAIFSFSVMMMILLWFLMQNLSLLLQ